jgi:hypothetical protein
MEVRCHQIQRISGFCHGTQVMYRGVSNYVPFYVPHMTLTNNHYKELKNFLEAGNPKELHKAIQTFYFSFTMDKNNKGLLPENFDEMSAEVFYLLEFLEQLEELAKSSAKK